MTLTQHYLVSGMTCQHCVASVTEEVGALPGVSQVEVDLDTGRLRVSGDADVSYTTIAAAVSEAGYTLLAG